LLFLTFSVLFSSDKYYYRSEHFFLEVNKPLYLS
jgi:hypothetical protein